MSAGKRHNRLRIGLYRRVMRRFMDGESMQRLANQYAVARDEIERVLRVRTYREQPRDWRGRSV